MRNSAILLEVNIQPLGLEVLGYHGSRLNDASLLGKIGLCEGSSIRGLSDLLSNQLVGPLLGLGPIIGVDSGDYERHVEGLFGAEGVVSRCMWRTWSC